MGFAADVTSVRIDIPPSKSPDYDIARLIESYYSGGLKYWMGVGILWMALLGAVGAYDVLTSGALSMLII